MFEIICDPNYIPVEGFSSFNRISDSVNSIQIMGYEIYQKTSNMLTKYILDLKKYKNKYENLEKISL